MMFIFGLLLVALGISGTSDAQTTVEFSTANIDGTLCLLFRMVEGAFGALLMTVAGVGAIISSAFGMYRAAYSAIIVACGVYSMRPLVSLWFGDISQDCPGILDGSVIARGRPLPPVTVVIGVPP